MSYPTDLKYTKEHEWIKVDGTNGTIGITDFAQQQLGDVVYVELPEVGSTMTAGQVFGTALRRMIGAFEDRAAKLYGKSSPSANSAA